MSRLTFLLLLALVACENPFARSDDTVELQVERSTYSAGETVVAALINRSDESVDYGCKPELERQTPEGWHPVIETYEQLCVTVGYPSLQPGRSTPRLLELDRTLSPGQYRLYHYYHFSGGTAERRRIHSQPFEVRGPA